MICRKELIRQAKRRDATSSLKAPNLRLRRLLAGLARHYDRQPTDQLRGDDLDDCKQEGPVVKFKVG